MGKAMKDASDEERESLRAEGKTRSAAVKELEEAQSAAESDVQDLQMALSNVVSGAPAGGEDDFVVLEHVGEPRDFDFTPKDHLELGESLGLIDMERGAKVSGARFYFLTGDGALLQLGMLQLAAQKARDHGFQLMIPPVLVRPEIMAGTGFLGAHADEIYRLEADDMFLVGTSEVALAGYHKDEIIDLSDGPVRYAGWSSCFRREAGSYGKDTRGHPARAPVRQGRDVRLLPPGGRRAAAPGTPGDGEGHARRRPGALPRHRRGRRRPRLLGRPQVRHGGLGPHPGDLP
jgi:seryl-tRNA synthetase